MTGNDPVRPRSVEEEHYSNWIFADRVSRFWLAPVLLVGILTARQLGLPYPFKPCIILFTAFIAYNSLLQRFLKRRSRVVADTSVYLVALLLNTITLGATIHFTGGIESVLVSLTALIVIFSTLFLTFGQCVFVSIVSATVYATVLALEYTGALPHYHIFPGVPVDLYA